MLVAVLVLMSVRVRVLRGGHGRRHWLWRGGDRRGGHLPGGCCCAPNSHKQHPAPPLPAPHCPHPSPPAPARPTPTASACVGSGAGTMPSFLANCGSARGSAFYFRVSAATGSPALPWALLRRPRPCRRSPGCRREALPWPAPPPPIQNKHKLVWGGGGMKSQHKGRSPAWPLRSTRSGPRRWPPSVPARTGG